VRDSHDPRCERSTTKRCRCDCQGRLHGVEATQIDLTSAAARAVLPLKADTAWIYDWFAARMQEAQP
jgi:hypothetical protein